MQRQQASEKRQGTKSRGGEHPGAARAYGDLTGRAVIALMDAEGGLLACLEGWMRESAARPRSREQRRAKGAIGWELLGGGGMMAHRSAVHLMIRFPASQHRNAIRSPRWSGARTADLCAIMPPPPKSSHPIAPFALRCSLERGRAALSRIQPSKQASNPPSASMSAITARPVKSP